MNFVPDHAAMVGPLVRGGIVDEAVGVDALVVPEILSNFMCKLWTS